MRQLLLAIVLTSAGAAYSEDLLRVGIHDKPPFAMKGDSGEWEGIGVTLWKQVAAQTGLKFQFVEMPHEEILPAVADGRLEAAVGEMEITADAEKLVNFTQPFLQSSTGVAHRHGAWNPDWFAIAKEFFNWTLVQVLLAILGGLILVSALIWIVERDHHVGHFRGGVTGFGSALWFSLTTMTTVGYGDKTPSTFWGRAISMVWMLGGILLVASFTAAVASSVSAARVSEMITRPNDLFRVSCGTLNGSVAQRYLREHGIPSRSFETVEDALVELSAGKIQAVVADKLTLQFLQMTMRNRHPDARFSVSNISFQEVFVGIPVRSNLPAFEAINVAVLSTLSSPDWEATMQRWLGRSSSQ